MLDAILTAKAKSTLAMDEFVSAFDINVNTDDGKVTLKGDVDSFAQSDHAVNVIERLDDVEHVVNRISVGRSKSGMDKLHESVRPARIGDTRRENMESRLNSAFERESLFDGSDIAVSIRKDGIALLRGHAPESAVKRAAEYRLWAVPEVRYVINRITSDRPVSESELRDRDRHDGSAAAADEGQNEDALSSVIATMKLKASFWLDGSADPVGLSAHVTDGVLHVDGDVDNYREKERVVSRAEHLYPEKEVEDGLSVGETAKERPHPSRVPLATPEGHYPVAPLAEPYPGGAPIWLNAYSLDDDQQEEAVQEFTLKLKRLDGDSAVEVKVGPYGTAYLRGNVPNEEMLHEVEEMAWKTRGVTHVVNKLNAA